MRPLLVALLFAASPAASQASLDDGWSSGFSGAGDGANDTIEALVSTGTDLVATGRFTTVGGVSANYIASWSGPGTWAPLSSGLSDFGFCLATYSNAVVVGGRFTSAGASAANRIAQWSGSWSPLGTGLDGDVNALAVHQGALIAGGLFVRNGDDVTVNRIASWGGSVWNPLGGGLNGAVEALASYGGEVIAAGSFTTAGGSPASRIARWDGVNWHAMGDGFDATVYALTVVRDSLFAGGSFESSGATSMRRIAVWNGTTWLPFGPGVGGTAGAVKSLLPVDTHGQLHLFVAGGAITTWNQDANGYVLHTRNVARCTLDPEGPYLWSSLGSGLSGPASVDVLTSVVHDGFVFFGGSFVLAGGDSSVGLAQWDDEAAVSVMPPRGHVASHLAIEAAPNPFASSTIISFFEMAGAETTVDVHDIRGRLVSRVVWTAATTGRRSIRWPATNHPVDLPDGLYFARVRSGLSSEVTKLVMRSRAPIGK